MTSCSMTALKTLSRSPVRHHPLVSHQKYSHAKGSIRLAFTEQGILSKAQTSTRQPLHHGSFTSRAVSTSSWLPQNEGKNQTTATKATSTSPFNDNNKSSTPRQQQRKRAFVPRKAAVQLTPQARSFFKSIIASHQERKNPATVGVMLNFRQAQDGQPRMVFTFDFVTEDQIGSQDEGVSLEVLEDGKTPKPPPESASDGLPKLYVHSHAFLKVLGATVDISEGDGMPCVLDGEGNRLDPNV